MFLFRTNENDRKRNTGEMGNICRVKRGEIIRFSACAILSFLPSLLLYVSRHWHIKQREKISNTFLASGIHSTIQVKTLTDPGKTALITLLSLNVKTYRFIFVFLLFCTKHTYLEDSQHNYG